MVAVGSFVDGEVDAAGGAGGVPILRGPIEYEGLEILSPMVRASQLPLRLCCLQSGAGLVYSGCEIDRKVIATTRAASPSNPCVDFYHAKEDRSIYSTCAEERGRNIFQLGTSNAPLAVQAALHVCNDVRGIDVNMGCCEDFLATIGGGSALLRKPDLVADILKSLRRELPPECALSCKIRLLDSAAHTRDFMQLCEQCGVDAIAVHMRRCGEAFSETARWQEVLSCCDAVSVPVIANGGFLTRAEIQAFWRQCGTAADEGGRRPAALMIGRGALMDPSIFDRSLSCGSSRDEVMRNYLRTTMRVGNRFENTKWTIKEMINRPSQDGVPCRTFGGLTARPWKQFKHQISNAKNIDEMCALFGADVDQVQHSQVA